MDAEGCIKYHAHRDALRLEISQKHPQGLEAIIWFLALQDPPVTASLFPGQRRSGGAQAAAGGWIVGQLALNAMSESGEFSGSYFEARGKGADLKGLQMRYERLTPAGCLRAREIKRVYERLCYCQSNAAEAGAAHAQLELEQLRAAHALASARESYALLRADIRQRIQPLARSLPEPTPCLSEAAAAEAT